MPHAYIEVLESVRPQEFVPLAASTFAVWDAAGPGIGRKNQISTRSKVNIPQGPRALKHEMSVDRTDLLIMCLLRVTPGLRSRSLSAEGK